MIKKREIFRSCLDHFDYDRIADYTEQDVERIMNTEGMIRSRRKTEAIIKKRIVTPHVKSWQKWAERPMTDSF